MNARTGIIMVSSIALALPLLGAHCSSSAAHGNGACGAGGETTCGALLDRTTTRRSGRVDAAPGAGHPSGIARLRSLGVDPTKVHYRDGKWLDDRELMELQDDPG